MQARAEKVVPKSTQEWLLAGLSAARAKWQEWLIFSAANNAAYAAGLLAAFFFFFPTDLLERVLVL